MLPAYRRRMGEEIVRHRDGCRSQMLGGKHPFDRQLYRERHLIECCFSKLKQFRRVATGYEKTARNYLAVVTLAATILWLR